MKVLKWLWVVALLSIGFKLYSLVSAGPAGYGPKEMDAFVGMVLIFALLSVVLSVLWIIGRARNAVSNKMAERKMRPTE